MTSLPDRYAFLAALAMATATPASAALTPAERTMIATVDTEQERTLGMLQRWVDQNSGSHNIAGVEAVGRMIRAELEPLSFTVRFIPLRQTGRAGHLVAHHPGMGKKLLLIGHLDTVFELDSPFQKWIRKGDRANGPGASDDKGGDAVIVASLRAMQAAGTLGNADITLFLTGDEEDSGSPLDLARRDLIGAGKAADVALDFEGLAQQGAPNGQKLDMGSVARRGAASWTLTVTANPGHSSGIFSKEAGDGAIYELARVIEAFRTQLLDDKLTYNVGLIGGGQSAALDNGKIRLAAAGKTNIIAATAVARGDLRALTPAQFDRTVAKMRAIVATPLPGARTQIAFDEDAYPPMAPTPGNRALLARLNRINADMGLPQMAELDPLNRGAGDISFVGKDVDGLIGLGPASTGDHTRAETVDIPSLFRQAKRAAILMSRLAVEAAPKR
ncbi:MAG: M20 family metallopeptidase [Sphingomicrobium sp.]